jgi:chondroitinase B-like protein
MIPLPSDNGKRTTVESMSELRNAVEKAKDEWKDTGGHIIIKKPQIDDPRPFEDDLKFKKPLVIRANNIGDCTIGGTGQIAVTNARNVWLYGINFRHHTSEERTVLFKECKNCVIAGCDFQTTSSNEREDEEENKKYLWYNYLAVSGGDCNCVAYNNFHDKQPSRGHFLWLAGGERDENNHIPIGPKRTVIEYNLFKNLPGIKNKDGKMDKGEAIKMGDSKLHLKAFGSIVRYNVFKKCQGDAEVITNKSSCNIYHHNSFRGNIGSLVLRHGIYNIVRDNFFLGRYNGIRVYGNKQLVKNNFFRSSKKLDKAILGPLVIGFGKVAKEEESKASYVKVKDSHFLENIFVTEALDNDSEDSMIVAWGRKGSGSDFNEMPDDNKFQGNIIVARTGTMLKLAHEDAKKGNNEFKDNIMFNQDSAKFGDILRANQTPDQCRPPGAMPQITEPTLLQETDVGPKSTRSDQTHCSREELDEVIDLSEGPQEEELTSLGNCS